MELHNYSKEYFDMVMSPIRDLALKSMSQNREQLEVSMQNTFLDIENSETPTKNASPYEIFIIDKLFRPFGEIIESMEAIEQIPLYVRTFPYGKYNISKLSWLRYNVENYFHEIYILKERLIKYLNCLKKAYKHTPNVPPKIEPVFSFVHDSLEKFTDARSAHVHEARLNNDSFRRLNSLYTLSLGSDTELTDVTNSLFMKGYKKERKAWAKMMSENFERYEKILNFYCEILLKAISQNGKLLLPQNIRNP